MSIAESTLAARALREWADLWAKQPGRRKVWWRGSDPESDAVGRACMAMAFRLKAEGRVRLVIDDDARKYVAVVA